MLNHKHSSLTLAKPLTLECGATLSNVEVAYDTYGTLNDERSNAVLVVHALIGWPAAHEWWSGLIGEGKLIDPQDHFIISPNLLGSCYGTTGPASINPATGKAYDASFPEIAPRDMARAILALLDQIGIERVQLGIAGSLGGMVLLELSSLAPDRFEAIVPIAVSGSHSAWRIAFSSCVRKVITAADPTLLNRTKLQEGMRLARQVAMATYRSFDQRFGRERKIKKFEVENYLEHQGDKIVARFSPYSYLTLSRAMELYELETPVRFANPTLFVGISSDILYEPSEISNFASQFPQGEFALLEAAHGHDSFLVDTDALSEIIRASRAWRGHLGRVSKQQEVTA
jgi:homoserine O-acetyltransferase